MAFADDNMSDDVFIGTDDDLAVTSKKLSPHPSPTGYRDYKAPTTLLKKIDEYETIHKVSILYFRSANNNFFKRHYL